MSDKVIKLDIRPPASIYGTFSRLSYEQTCNRRIC